MNLIKIDGKDYPVMFRTLLGMTWVGWLNFLLLQWFGLRLCWSPTVVEGRAVVRLRRLEFLAWPLSRWYWSWRVEIVVPCLLCLPSLCAVAALVWWLAC